MITGELKSKVDRIWDTMWSVAAGRSDERNPRPDGVVGGMITVAEKM